MESLNAGTGMGERARIVDEVDILVRSMDGLNVYCWAWVCCCFNVVYAVLLLKFCSRLGLYQGLKFCCCKPFFGFASCFLLVCVSNIAQLVNVRMKHVSFVQSRAELLY